MRVTMADEHMGNPMVHTAEYFAPEIVKAAWAFSKASYQHSVLSLREFEGARARTAEINGCVVCRTFRGHRDLPGYFETFGGDAGTSVQAHGTPPDEPFYENVSRWATYPNYSERERVAIAFAERMGTDPQAMAEDGAFWARAKAVFSDNELVDLAYNCACWIGLGRVQHVLGFDTACAFVPMEQSVNEAA